MQGIVPDSNRYYPRLIAPVTLNRIRDACQNDANKPAMLLQGKIHALVNDFNALGIPIPLRDDRGRSIPHGRLCEMIRDIALPNVAEVCMVNERKKNTRGLVEGMVRHFNKFYGAQISILKNPLNPAAGTRSISDLCDDLYMVADKMARKLSDHPNLVKNKLIEGIQQLQTLKHELDRSVPEALRNLSMSQRADRLQEELQDANKTWAIVNRHLKTQIDSGRSALVQLQGQPDITDPGIASAIKDHVSPLSGMLNMYPNLQNEQKRIAQLLAATASIPTVVNNCTECLRTLRISPEEYYDDSNRPELNSKILQSFLTLQRELSRTGDQRALTKLARCYEMLIQDRAMCQANNNRTSTLPISGVINQGAVTALIQGLQGPLSQALERKMQMGVNIAGVADIS